MDAAIFLWQPAHAVPGNFVPRYACLSASRQVCDADGCTHIQG